jgi:Flp pilus assembly pilin Flp
MLLYKTKIRIKPHFHKDFFGDSVLSSFGIARAERMEMSYRGCQSENHLLKRLLEDDAQDIAEYAVMLAIILVLLIGAIRLIGSNSNNVFSTVSSSIH